MDIFKRNSQLPKDAPYQILRNPHFSATMKLHFSFGMNESLVAAGQSSALVILWLLILNLGYTFKYAYIFSVFIKVLQVPLGILRGNMEVPIKQLFWPGAPRSVHSCCTCVCVSLLYVLFNVQWHFSFNAFLRRQNSPFSCSSQEPSFTTVETAKVSISSAALEHLSPGGAF